MIRNAIAAKLSRTALEPEIVSQIELLTNQLLECTDESSRRDCYWYALGYLAAMSRVGAIPAHTVASISSVINMAKSASFDTASTDLCDRRNVIRFPHV